MEELNEICQIEGIDMIFFGPADFSHSIGVPGQFDDPRIEKARIKIAETANKYGKFAGTVGSLINFEELTSIGYNFVSIGADVVGLQNYCKDIMTTIRKKHSEKVGIYEKPVKS
jgi:4-hydroxy-2-oxoheptanedioate aldolase